MSALTPIADIDWLLSHVRFVPIADIATPVPRGELSKVVNFEQKILLPSLVLAGRIRAADLHTSHMRFAEPNVALRTRGRGRTPRKHVHKQ